MFIEFLKAYWEVNLILVVVTLGIEYLIQTKISKYKGTELRNNLIMWTSIVVIGTITSIYFTEIKDDSTKIEIEQMNKKMSENKEYQILLSKIDEYKRTEKIYLKGEYLVLKHAYNEKK